MTTISYAITVSTEIREFSNLMHHLIEQFTPTDEIVILVDESKGFSEEIEVFEADNIHYHYDCFKDDFASWKNQLNSYCTKEWICQLDADELLSDSLLRDMHILLESNSTVDCIWIPRSNTVNGITSEDIQRWGWSETNYGINWPDYQRRLYRNTTKIKWQGRVHEKPEGYKTYTLIPSNQNMYKLDHIKDIERQRRQNEYYSTL